MTVIEIHDLTKRYGDRVALAGVSLTVEVGEIVGIVGPNGAGKTTTVECVSGLRHPDGGRVRVLGFDPARAADRTPLHEVLGVQLQESALPDRITVREALELFASFYRRPAEPARLMSELGLSGHRDTAYAKLSGGLKQRLSIALALVGDPQVAILDELTTGLDPQARRETWQLIEQVRARGVTILLVTHFMDEAEQLCDRVAVIHNGRIVALGRPAELVNHFGTGQRLTFTVDAGTDTAGLADLPSVSTVDIDGDQVRLAGSGNVLADVLGEMSRHGVIPRDLRVHQPSLEDAYLALTTVEGQALTTLEGQALATLEGEAR
jgi:ABC-2 type transport system ATP-binding protein